MFWLFRVNYRFEKCDEHFKDSYVFVLDMLRVIMDHVSMYIVFLEVIKEDCGLLLFMKFNHTKVGFSMGLICALNKLYMIYTSYIVMNDHVAMDPFIILFHSLKKIVWN